MVTLMQWLAADDNQELCDIAGDIAYDAIAGYFDARDLPRPVTAIQCKDLAAEIAYADRDGWEYPAADKNDPTGEIAKKVLAKHGFRIRAGVIGFDAVLTKD